MKILSVLLVVFTLIGFSDSDKLELVGVWVLTDFDESNKFENYWEFKENGVFNELKSQLESEGNLDLKPDENGTWSLEDNKLRITVTGEDTGGEQKLYDKPQILEFEAVQLNDEIILTVLYESSNSKLRLTKRD